MEELIFEPYSHKQHYEELNDFSNDARGDSFNRYLTYGLLNLRDEAGDFIELYDPLLNTRSETVHPYVLRAKSETEARIVGFCVLNWSIDEEDRKTLAVFHIVIRPSEQGKRYGTKAIEEIIKNGKTLVSNNYDEIFCSVDKKNDASRKMFEKLGFVKEASGFKYDMYSRKEREFSKEAKENAEAE